MAALFKMQVSRDSWKLKAIQRGEEERYLRKELGRAKEKIKAQRGEIRELKTEAEILRANKFAPINGKVDLIYISLLIFLIGRISFRGTSRVLSILSQYLGIKAPSAQTIINWTTKLSLVRMKYAYERTCAKLPADHFANGFIWIIDTSIALSAGKILTVLALDINHFKNHSRAPNLQDIHCVGVSVASSWTGELIAEFLKQIIGRLGRPVALLKDGGTDLFKAASILIENGTIVKSIADVSHVVANLLKHKYEKCPQFKHFLCVCGKASKMLKQTLLACIAPPKVSTKARFMNVHKLVAWAQQVLDHSPAGRAKAGSILAKLRLAIGELPWCKKFIQSFLADALPLLECQKILKTRGLSVDTQQECLKILESQKVTKSIFKDFSHWMTRQLSVAKELGLSDAGIPVSSDTIESLFGVAKHHGVGPIKDPNRIALRIPTLCGSLTLQEAQRVMEISTLELETIEKQLTSLTKQRREILPNPGTLEKLEDPAYCGNLELLPGSKFREKTKDNLLTACFRVKMADPELSAYMTLTEMENTVILGSQSKS